MNKITFSACPIYDRDDLPFDKEEYSRFKYGSKTVARKFGKILATRFWVQLLRNNLPDLPIVVYPSPYNFIPTATFVMKDYFIKYLNEYLVSCNKPPVKEGKIYRNSGYITDYGSMSPEERDRVMQDDRLHIDSHFVQNKVLIFLDDIRVTGSHERRIDQMVNEYELNNQCYYVYFASVEDPTIESQFEDYLNLNSITGLIDISKIIRNEEFAFNTRVVKYILSSPPDEFKIFIQYQSDTFVDTLWHYAMGNSYHLEDTFKENYNFLTTICTN